MFEHHFGLRENPFAAGHHAKFVYPSPEHQEAIAHLRYGIENREPFVLITGEVGTGKTTALFDALSEWQSRVEVALITNSALTQNELLEEIALRFGVPISGPSSKPQILAHLERVLAGVYARGDRAILLLDEAQNLERELLEEIRLLSNLERDGTKLVQVFLVGQPELEEKLARVELRQLRQRITVHYRLRPLSVEDTEHYIQHRILVAGGHASTIFPSKACLEVYRLTHGIPREINSLASQSLLNAFVDDARAVAPSHVLSAATELEFRSVLDRSDLDVREQPARDPGRAAAPNAEPPAPAEPSRPAIERRRPAPPEPEVRGPIVRETAESGSEDIDIKMIEAWMAELSRSKHTGAASAAAPPLASSTARAAASPASRPPAEPSRAPAPPAETRPAQPRSLAAEQRGALPPRPRASYGDSFDEESEDFLPRSRGRGVLIVSLVAVALVVGAIVLVRFGVLSGLPFMPAAPKPATSVLPPPAPAVAVVDSAVRATATDSLKRVPLAETAPQMLPPAAATPAIKSPPPGAKSATGTAANQPASQPAGELPAGKPTSASSMNPPKAAAGAATFGISVATYLNQDRAESERAKLAASTRLPISIQVAKEDGSSVYHLVVGGFETRASAEDAASDLIQKGLVEEARIVAGPRIAKR